MRPNEKLRSCLATDVGNPVMRLIVATDHRFYRTSDGVYDTYCFHRSFFDDYRTVFEQVVVAARMIQGDAPEGARRSDGDGVEFLALPNTGGVRHVLLSGVVFRRHLDPAIRAADAVCVRVPSWAGWHAFKIARRLGKPVMFEMIGDPAAALHGRQYGWLTSLIGAQSARRLRIIPPHCVAGSYVSKEYLQGNYPAGSDTVTDSVSSIRLPLSWLQPPLQFDVPQRPLQLVLVASLVPVKWHEVLIRGLHMATGLGADLHLRLAGDGPLRPYLETLVAELGIEDRVQFLGHVSDRDKLLEILDSSHLFVMTSASEGMPRAMIEAMARGLPAIGSDVGGISELLEPDQKFPAGDDRRLGQMLHEAQRRPELLTEYARRSAATAREYVSDTLSQRRRRLLRVLRSASATGQ